MGDKLILTYEGKDYWGAETYRTEEGKLLKNTRSYDTGLELYTVSDSNDFDSEMEYPIEQYEKYKGKEIVVTNPPKQVTPRQEFVYRMLGRLISDCEYFLGYGNAYEGHLWAKNVEDQIKEMRTLYDELPEDMKPDLLTLSDIENYEAKMLELRDGKVEF